MKDNFDDLVDRASSNGEGIIVRRGRRTVAAVVPVKDLRILEAIEDKMDIDEALAGLNEPTVSWPKVKSTWACELRPMIHRILSFCDSGIGQTAQSPISANHAGY
jgi:antitoxin (DNA-binding transcriptional repressor) of toxin-antitoxin stability system